VPVLVLAERSERSMAQSECLAARSEVRSVQVLVLAERSERSMARLECLAARFETRSVPVSVLAERSASRSDRVGVRFGAKNG
jgi:hypothetical protein